MQIFKLEGFAIPLIGFRLTDEQLQKLNEILDKLGVGALKNGDDRSEKLRNFIDTLHSEYVLRNPVTVTTQQPQVSDPDWFCLKGLEKHPNPEMQVTRCQICKTKDWNKWKACQDYKLARQKR